MRIMGRAHLHVSSCWRALGGINNYTVVALSDFLIIGIFPLVVVAFLFLFALFVMFFI